MPRMQDTVITVQTTGDEGTDHDLIEAIASALLPGWEPIDAEMGEWLLLSKNGKTVRVEVTA